MRATRRRLIPIDRVKLPPRFGGAAFYAVISSAGVAKQPGSTNNLLGPNPDRTLIDKLSNHKQVTAQTPPTLLVTALDDLVVRPEHSHLMLAALQKAGIPSEFQT